MDVGLRASATLQAELDGVIAGRSRRTAGPDGPELEAALDEALRGGKRFRPRLAAHVHDELGGSAGPAVAQVGAALELLHTCFLVHDDLIDDDDLRRGRPSVLGRFRRTAQGWGAGPAARDTYARAAAVLVGDLALAHALRALALCEVDAATRARLLDLFDEAIGTSADGQLADVRQSLGVAEVTLTEALDMELRKTAVYSFCLPLQAGAVLAGAAPSTVAALRRLGEHLGVAYQLLDDLDGAFGSTAETGKSVLGDLREGKRTPLLLHAGRTAAGAELLGFVGRADLGPADVARVRHLLDEAGSRHFVEALVGDHLAEAAGLASSVGLSLDALCGLASMPPRLTGEVA